MVPKKHASIIAVQLDMHCMECVAAKAGIIGIMECVAGHAQEPPILGQL